MDLKGLHELSASEAARLIRLGAISSEQLVEACLARVRERDAQVQAWSFLDPDHALDQARSADQWRLSGQPLGPPMIGALLLFTVFNLLGFLPGYWLRKSRRRGGVLGIIFLAVSSVFWWGFGLPIPPLVGLLHIGLLAAGWKSLNGETA